MDDSSGETINRTRRSCFRNEFLRRSIHLYDDKLILKNSWEEIRQELNVELDDNRGRVEVHVRTI